MGGENSGKFVFGKVHHPPPESASSTRGLLCRKSVMLRLSTLRVETSHIRNGEYCVNDLAWINLSRRMPSSCGPRSVLVEGGKIDSRELLSVGSIVRESILVQKLSLRKFIIRIGVAHLLGNSALVCRRTFRAQSSCS